MKSNLNYTISIVDHLPIPLKSPLNRIKDIKSSLIIIQNPNVTLFCKISRFHVLHVFIVPPMYLFPLSLIHYQPPTEIYNINIQSNKQTKHQFSIFIVECLHFQKKKRKYVRRPKKKKIRKPNGYRYCKKKIILKESYKKKKKADESNGNISHTCDMIAKIELTFWTISFDPRVFNK